MKKWVFSAALLSLAYGYAQDNTMPMEEPLPVAFLKVDEPKAEDKIEIKPAGRILIDGGAFGANKYHNEFVSGVAMPDIRAGLGVRYGNWKAKVDIGYAYNALSVKDVLMEYGFSKHTLLRGGYFVHQFGMQSATSSSFKISMEEPQSNEAFFNGRLVGLMLMHQKDKFFGTLSLFAENEAMKQTPSIDAVKGTGTGSQGMGMMSRLLYRPRRDEGNIFHVGISGAFETPRYNKKAELNHSSYTLKTPFPTRIAKVTAQQAFIDNATFLYKFSPELLLAKNRWGLEAQYYYVNVNRKSGFEAFDASGAYAMVRTIIKGSPYTYADADGGIATPKAGAMELVAGYNYTDLSNRKAGILGGRLNDYSLTFNYYLNKYMIWRVRASHTAVGYRAGREDTNLNLIETRLQIKF
jgi:phosphate-selective porin O and P